MPPQTSSQLQSTAPAIDIDVAEDDTEAAASATAGPARCLLGTGMAVGMMFEPELKRSRTSSWSTASGMPHYSARHLIRLSNSGGRSGV
ncbi:hypothetical protein PIB30_098633 [Stylosanthes scabra]|uniref:Uncharacterized protein n=1 Tax=Stylosanthes scabra TaxID=79078 RepID=A0ABU6ZVE2_9FABA|nr:hypothetical protein [Stylosanthes scabra]